MTQQSQFNPEDQAPEQWVQAVERAGAGAARWRDGSWGNNAAPSWELVDPDDALYAEAFYYAPENAERFRDTFGAGAYVSLVLYQEDEIVGACDMEAATFLDVARSAARATLGDPMECLRQALQGVGLSQRIIWERPEHAP